MRPSLLALAFVSLGIPLAAPAAAQPAMTAGALAAMCANRAQQGACASYIQGYVDGRNQSLPKPTVCLSASTSIADAAAGFAEYVGKNRLEANLQAGLVLGNFLITTFPCR